MTRELLDEAKRTQGTSDSSEVQPTAPATAAENDSEIGSESVFISRNMARRIFNRDDFNTILETSGASIAFEKEPSDTTDEYRKFTLTGTTDAVEQARGLLQDMLTAESAHES